MNKRIFDAFGTKISVGDWVYYTRNPNMICIGKIESLNYDGPNYAILNPFTNEDIFQAAPYFFDGKTTLDTSCIKCYNKPLIETLESILKHKRK